MSRYLQTKNVFITTGPAIAPNHDGTPYTNTDFPTGTIIGEGVDGEWYYFQPPFSTEDYADRLLWKKKTKYHQHFRDYWRILAHSPGAPYYEAFMSAPRKQLGV